MFVKRKEEPVKTRRMDCSAFKILSNLQLRMKFLSGIFFFTFSFRVTKVKVAFWSVFISLLSENGSPKVWAGARTQSSFLVLVPLHVNCCMYTHATHKESILAHSQPKEAGHCGLLLGGNWQPFFCKQQPDVTPCSSDSRPTSEILAELLKVCYWLWSSSATLE